jgi:hypothetical protein
MRVAFSVVFGRKAKASLASSLIVGLLLSVWVSEAAAFRILTNHEGDKLGGYQTFVARHKGRVLLGFGLIERGGRYRLCVDSPEGKTVCHKHRLRFASDSGAYVSFIDWAKRFPTRGDGTFKASWFKAGQRMGPKLEFAKP